MRRGAPVLRYPKGQKAETVETSGALAQMSSPVLLLAGSGIRTDAPALQTWAPFTIQVCVNGREWLARQMDREGIGYEKHDNCFTRIDNLERAQQLFTLLDQQAWAGWLEKLAAPIHPFLRGKSDLHFKPYYWSLGQSEYATDILFRDSACLKEIYPALLQHAIHHFQCKDVLGI